MIVAVDYHKKNLQVVKGDPRQTKPEGSFRMANTPENLKALVESVGEGDTVVLEACSSWYHFCDLMEESGATVKLAHPYKVRLIAESRNKSDKHDAETLWQLERMGWLPTSYIATREERDDREMLRYEAFLVSMRTRLKNQVRSLLSKNGLTSPYSNVFGVKGYKHLEGLEVREAYRSKVTSLVRLSRFLETEIKRAAEWIKNHVESNPEATKLLDIPGISYFTALLIVSEIGDIRRFPNAMHLCSYAGLAPTRRQSDEVVRGGPITKQGSRWLRWILIEMVHHVISKSDRLRAVYEEIEKRRGAGRARIAVARRVLGGIYALLRRGEAFEL